MLPILNPTVFIPMAVLVAAGFGIIAKDQFERGSVNPTPLVVSIGVLVFIGLAFAQLGTYGAPGYGHSASSSGLTLMLAGIVAVVGMFVAPFFIIIVMSYALGYIAWNVTGRKRIEAVPGDIEPQRQPDTTEEPQEARSVSKKPVATAFGKRKF